MMKFNFSGSEVPTAVAFVASQCKSNVVEIYKHLLLVADAERGSLTIRGSNGGYHLSRVIMLPGIQESGSVCVDAQKFAEITRSVKDAGVVAVSFAQQGEKITGTVMANRSKFKIACIEAAAFPAPELCDSQLRVAFDSCLIRKAFERVSRTISSDSHRQILNAACVEFQEGFCEVVGSDGYRLTKQCVNYQIKGSEPVAAGMQLVIPRQQLGQIISLLSQDEGREVFFVVDSGRVAVIDPVGGWRFQFALVDEKYPAWRRVIPTPQAGWTAIEVQREYLAACLNRAQILTDKQNTVSLHIHQGELTLSTTGDDGTEGASEVVPATVTREGTVSQFKFNVRYLLQALNSLAGDVVRIAIEGNQGKSLIDSDGDPRALQVLAQIR